MQIASSYTFKIKCVSLSIFHTNSQFVPFGFIFWHQSVWSRVHIVEMADNYHETPSTPSIKIPYDEHILKSKKKIQLFHTNKIHSLGYDTCVNSFD